MPSRLLRDPQARWRLAAFILLAAVMIVGFWRIQTLVDANRKNISRVQHLETARQRDRVDARRVLCRRDERFAKAQRLDAWRGWNALPATLRILKLDDTPTIRSIARKALYRNLKRFAPIDCDIFARDAREVHVTPPAAERREGLPPKAPPPLPG